MAQARTAAETRQPGGSVIAKGFRGGTEHTLLAMLKQNFDVVAHIIPPSSRQQSVEVYVCARGFKGRREEG